MQLAALASSDEGNSPGKSLTCIPLFSFSLTLFQRQQRLPPLPTSLSQGASNERDLLQPPSIADPSR